VYNSPWIRRRGGVERGRTARDWKEVGVGRGRKGQKGTE
jgi:hypothetical protein